MKKRIVTTAALVLCACGTINLPLANAQPARSKESTPGSLQTQSFDSFWAAFRAALLSGDTDLIVAMTQFPLEVRSDLDQDPVRHVAQPALRSTIERALSADTGLSLRERLTNRMLVERVGQKVQPTRGVSLGPDAARIGAFAFERGAAGWRLRRLYLPES